MAEPLDVEISLVNTNQRELLGKCLSSLAPACAGLSWRVVVVDNASTDGSAEMVQDEFPEARLLRNDRRQGFSSSHNRVLGPICQEELARYALILNEDTELAPGSVVAMVERADADPRLGAVGPRIVDRNGREEPSYFGFPRVGSELLRAFHPSARWRPAETGWLNGACLMVRVAALKQVGLLDERFFIFYEDTDLGYRLLRNGWLSAVVPEARVLHHQHRSVSQETVSVAMEKQAMRSRFLYFQKHKGPLSAASVAAATRLGLVLRGLKASTAGLAVRSAAERDQGRLFFELARYRAGRPLPHESSRR
jgi:N-acetylglucosaminyl-diphospho-decaprenol L-rhamnosyltransferase